MLYVLTGFSENQDGGPGSMQQLYRANTETGGDGALRRRSVSDGITVSC